MASTISKRTSKATEGELSNQSSSDNSDHDSSHHPRWTFLSNHSHVLVLLHNDPDVVLRRVALAVGITERAVQRIIHDLEHGGIIERERIGRRNHYKVLIDQPLRHAIESHRNIGDLLALFSKDE